jgi:hypothetical protein
VEFGHEADTRIERRSAASWERHMGEYQRQRLTLPKQRRLGVARLAIAAQTRPENKKCFGIDE